MKRIILVIVVLVGLGAYQYLTEGEISWLSRPDSAWRQATDTLNELFPAEGAPGTFDISGKVVRVADGDTVSVVDRNNDQHKIRLHGIDAPERDQPYGKVASSALSKLVSGRAVGVVVKDTDDYGRAVGVVYMEGDNINLQMVEEGHAWWYARYAGLDSGLKGAENRAREAQRGLWAGERPVAPWDWRRGRR